MSVRLCLARAPAALMIVVPKCAASPDADVHGLDNFLDHVARARRRRWRRSLRRSLGLTFRTNALTGLGVDPGLLFLVVRQILTCLRNKCPIRIMILDVRPLRLEVVFETSPRNLAVLRRAEFRK
jgi:hypothetical protein